MYRLSNSADAVHEMLRRLYEACTSTTKRAARHLTARAVA